MNTPYGNSLKLYIIGGSHDEKISMRLENFPAGIAIDFEQLYSFLERRAPGKNKYSTARSEDDKPCFLCGIENGTTNGEPIEAVIYNHSQKSSDYNFNDTPRPSHADFTAVKKYGSDVDLRGGGHFSGRLTAPYCIAGGLCLQYLSSFGINIFSHIYSIGNISDTPFNTAKVGQSEYDELRFREPRVLDISAGEKMKELILKVKAEGNSVGGVVECAITGLRAGLGEHMFASVEERIASAVFAIPAVKGIEFGNGFYASTLTGSENNDSFVTDGKDIYTSTNNCGGILGGITDGMPVVFRAAVKPTPSIALEQSTVSISRMENVKLTVGGRHDPCIVLRALPAFEAAAAVAITDMILYERHCYGI